MIHFNWTQLIPGVGHHYIHVATLFIVTCLLISVGLVARRKLASADMAPSGSFSIKGIFELLVEFIASLTEMVIGEHGAKFIPMFCAIFLFVLANNFAGLLPGMTPATENINTTLALGIFSFVTYNYYGLKENGLSYLKHFLGPVIWLSFLMLPIEIISHAVRPLSLGLRLAGNMTGDHTVLSIFLDLVPVGIPMVFYVLGIFVCFVQAFVFTLLSMVYVAMATAHDH